MTRDRESGAGVRLTSIQTSVLRLLAEGRPLARTLVGGGYWDDGSGYRVHPATLRPLVEAGLVEAVDVPLGRLDGFDLVHQVWRLTLKGEKA
jgi:hypothetical protein